MIQTSFFCEKSQETQNDSKERTEALNSQFRQQYRKTRAQICDSLKDNLFKIIETTNRKEKELGDSLETYSKLESSLAVILEKMNEILENTKIDEEKLKKTRNLADYGGSLIKIRNNNLKQVDKNKQFLRQASKEGEQKQFLETNAVSEGFLGSMKKIIWNKRKYFFRLVDYVSKIVIMNQVSQSGETKFTDFAREFHKFEGQIVQNQVQNKSTKKNEI